MSAWQLLWRLMTLQPRLFALNCLLWGLNAVLPLATGLALRWFFDALSAEAPVWANIWTPIAILAGVNLARVGIVTYGAYSFSTVFQGAAALLRGNLLEWLVVGPGTRALPDGTGEAVSRFRDDVEEAQRYLDNWVDLLGGLAFVVVGLVVMFAISPVLTLVVLAPLAAVVVITNRIAPELRRRRRVHREATSRVTDYIGETFGAAQAIKIAAAERPVVHRFDHLNHVRRRAAVSDRLFGELLRSVSANMANVGIGAILLLSVGSMRAGEFTVGDFALFTTYLTRMSMWVNFLGGALAQHKRLGVSIDRLERVLAGAPRGWLGRHRPIYFRGDLPAVPPIRRTAEDRFVVLETRDLAYHYPGTASGVDGVDLHIPRGQLVVVTGRIGAGKTTLLRALLGLVPRERGEIRWSGRVVDDPGSFMVPPRVAYTPQVPRLFSEPLRDNILFGQPEDPARLAETIELAVLDHDLAHLEHGLDTIVGPRGVRLSGGQIQRAAAARMFARDAELLILDDLSSALDVETERTLWERLRARTDLTCLAVSHRRAALLLADEVIVMKNGRVEARGRLVDLLERCDEMRELWRGELREEHATPAV